MAVASATNDTFKVEVLEWAKNIVPKTRGDVMRAHTNHMGMAAGWVSFFLVHNFYWDASQVLYPPSTYFYARLYNLGLDASPLSADALMVARLHLLAAVICWAIGHFFPWDKLNLEKVTLGKALVAQIHFMALVATAWGLHLSMYGLRGADGLPTGAVPISFDPFAPITISNVAGNHIAFGAFWFLGGVFHYFKGFNVGKFKHLNNDWEAVLSVSAQVLGFHFATVAGFMVYWQDPVVGFGFMQQYSLSQFAAPEIREIASTNPGYMLKQVIFGHFMFGTLFWIGGVFHGAHYLFRATKDPQIAEDLKNYKMLQRCFDHDFQKKILALVMFGAFSTIFISYGIATHNTIADLHANAKTGLFSQMAYIDIKPFIHDAIFGSHGTVSDFIAAHAIAGGIHFTMVPVWRMVFFSKVSPWTTKVGMKAKRDAEFPCLGPAYGGTCSISLVDQFYLAIFFSLQIIAPAWFWLDGCWMGSFVATSSDVYKAALAAYQADPTTYSLHTISVMSNEGYFSYIISQTVRMFKYYDGHMIQALLGAHFIWAYSFSMLFQYRGSRDEGAMVLKWAHEQVGLGAIGKVYNRALTLKEGKAFGTLIFYKMTIVAMWTLMMV
ncbi:hypothetical protein [Heliophilum fasciatum]|uniref:Photosystem I psaA/psaB protein n=1 Tax=Heliophilum fasciatum TaxID=35700 RepID=A0A4R2SB47_9FIRM|nr:hypothetical protein [Heliophilum fasciatum]MCW2277049.1 hypothetical protein [Heliophilum fasciatum]TCP68425.1 photosystem I psaA/psaB protein [Heliophilum fasciatum]